MRKAEFIAGIVLSALGGGIVLGAAQFPTIPGQDYGPGFFPTILGVGLLLSGAAYAINALRQPEPAAAATFGTVDKEGGETPADRPYYAALAWVLLGLGVIIRLWETVGFIVLLSVFLTGFMVLLKVALWRAALLAVVATVAVYLVFIRLLMVPLPAGILANLGL
ncbi:putative tricarboxylic transport membrane protein [Microvirga lupini]|uniref:Putative tricarboxylic transport membrane protein n=1 Tax=Microvirga lupini TaxID=420324 RepID=A0A7W4VPD2_9HYPH|nr:tripartite tricarboxylate transporter TctB family protein [Microvirga lupini]MBB3020490.1 putative tricarboxylic transport membrane protein [Microvirga lupini]